MSRILEQYTSAGGVGVNTVKKMAEVGLEGVQGVAVGCSGLAWAAGGWAAGRWRA